MEKSLIYILGWAACMGLGLMSISIGHSPDSYVAAAIVIATIGNAERF